MLHLLRPYLPKRQRLIWVFCWKAGERNPSNDFRALVRQDMSASVGAESLRLISLGVAPVGPDVSGRILRWRHRPF